jgi:hypothetical protein
MLEWEEGGCIWDEGRGRFVKTFICKQKEIAVNMSE